MIWSEPPRKLGEASDKEPRIQQIVDSDFMLVTNQKEIVKCAKICYEQYPTIVNALKESSIVYGNSKSDYAIMDNKF